MTTTTFRNNSSRKLRGPKFKIRDKKETKIANRSDYYVSMAAESSRETLKMRQVGKRPNGIPPSYPNPSCHPLSDSAGMPRKPRHRRTHSELPTGLFPPLRPLEPAMRKDEAGDDLFKEFINLSGGSSSSDNDNDATESTVRSKARHCRSASVDSSFMGRAASALDLRSEFSGAELDKIMADEKLAEIAVLDPKRVKRILANRQSAARSKQRKMHYISELERKVQTLQMEATVLSAQLTSLQRESAGLSSQNKVLKIRVQAMEQQAHLKDALNEALTAEVQRLKLANAKGGDNHLSCRSSS